MCSAPLDLFTMLERQGSDFSDAMRKMNPPTHLAQTMKRGVGGVNSKKNKDAINSKKMYEEAQMVRRVKAYLSKMPVIEDEEKLHKMSLEVEPPPQSSVSNSTTMPRTLTGQTSSASIGSQGVRLFYIQGGLSILKWN